MDMDALTEEQLMRAAEQGALAVEELHRRERQDRQRERDIADDARLRAVAAKVGISVGEAREIEASYHGTLHIMDGQPLMRLDFPREQGSPHPGYTKFVAVPWHGMIAACSQLIGPAAGRQT